MTICPHTQHQCHCQPQEGRMCPYGPQPPYPKDEDLPPMTKTVTRYADGGPEGWMQSPTGEFVRYDDIKHLLQDEPPREPVVPFVVKHYASDERPMIKGNGFDGLEIGGNREEAEEFVTWLNERLGVNRE